MKKIAILGVILLLAISFSAFAKGNTQSKSSSGKVELTFTIWGTEDERRTSQELVDGYNRLQDKVNITVRLIGWEIYVDTLNTLSIAGQMPDCGMMAEPAVLGFATRGLLADSSQMYGAGDNRPLDSLAFKGPDGKVVAYSAANEILLLYYNTDMFTKANVPLPPKNLESAWTWDEFVAAAKKLTFDANGRTPNDAGFDRNRIVQYGAMVENLPWQLEVWALSNGGSFFSPDGKQVTIDNPRTIEAIQRVADLHLVHNVAPLSAGLTDDGVPRSVIARTVAMTTNGQWNIGTSLFSAKKEGLNYGIGVLPYMGQKVTVNVGGPLVVFSQTKYPREAMDFIKWYSQAENCWGLIETGIWMPIHEHWYTNPEYTRKWVNNPAFPPYDDYVSAVITPARTVSKPASWYYTPNTDEFFTLLTSVLGPVWTGQTTAQQAITSNIAALRRAHAGQ